MSLRLAALISALVIPALLLSCGDGGKGSDGDATTTRPASGTGDPSKDTALMDPAVASIQAFIDENVDTSKRSWKTNLKAPPKATFTEGKSYFWEIQTNKGKIKLKLMPDVAPQHVTNTIFLVRSSFYDGLNFHRVIPGFMAQGGCPNGDGRGSPGFRYNGEFSSSVKHDRPGLLSMANAGPGTDGSQFFITFVPTGGLDGKHTIFGEVVDGMETVRALEAAGTPGAGRPREPLLMEKSTIIIE